MAGNWIEIDGVNAKNHPLYGIKGWLLFYLFATVFGMFISLGYANSAAHQLGFGFFEFLEIDSPATNYTSYALILEFIMRVAIILAAINRYSGFRNIATAIHIASWPATLIIALAIGIDYVSGLVIPALVPYVLTTVVWVAYLQRSRRVRVTFEYAINIKDNFCEEAIVRTRANATANESSFINRSAVQTEKSQPDLNKEQGATDHTYAENKAETALNDDSVDFWAQALDEFEGDKRNRGDWAKCFAEARGNEGVAKAEYLINAEARIRKDYIIKKNQERLQAINEASRQLTKPVNGTSTAMKYYRNFCSGVIRSYEEIRYLAQNIKENELIARAYNPARGENLLHVAAKNNMYEECVLFYGAGVDPRHSNAQGSRPYMLSANEKLKRYLFAAYEYGRLVEPKEFDEFMKIFELTEFLLTAGYNIKQEGREWIVSYPRGGSVVATSSFDLERIVVDAA